MEAAEEVGGVVLVYHKLAAALHLITDNLISLFPYLQSC